MHESTHQNRSVIRRDDGLSAGELLSLERGTVLLVEGEADLHRALSIRLIKEGFSVVSVYDGVHGIDRYIHTSPDVVVVDLALARLNGRRTLERLREFAFLRKVPFLVLARDPDRNFAEHVAAAGLTRVLEKPVRQAEVVAELDFILAPPEAA